MLNDIVDFPSGADMQIAQSEAPRAGNILATQIATLEYAPDMGIDLKYFLETEFRIQNESFKAYLVQRLLEQHVNVVNVIETINTLYSTYLFSVGSSENSEGLIE